MGVTAPATAHSPTGAPTAPDTPWTVLHADSLHALTELPAASIDAVVCDPPYGISFNGHDWDGRAIRQAAGARSTRPLFPGEALETWTQTWALECLRVLKPGGHVAAFGAARTFHRLACGVEDAGLELRDVLLWLYGTGMPKSRRLSSGRGTALKPAYEPILLARKPPDGPIQRNLDRHGTGALNIDACRVGRRWPANILLSHHPRCTSATCDRRCPARAIDAAPSRERQADSTDGPSRFFYCAKASRRERDAGCEQLPRHALDLFPNARSAGRRPAAAANLHPTVKPLALMRWLIRLLTPEHGLVLDPFCGSGSTGCAAVLEQLRFLGIDRETDYIPIARARLTYWTAQAERSVG